MGADNDTVLAINPGTGEEVVGRGGIDFRKDEGGSPAADGMAGRIGALAAKFLLLARIQEMIVKILERPDTVVVRLGLNMLRVSPRNVPWLLTID